jgi:hypothetical protein
MRCANKASPILGSRWMKKLQQGSAETARFGRDPAIVESARWRSSSLADFAHWANSFTSCPMAFWWEAVGARDQTTAMIK